MANAMPRPHRRQTCRLVLCVILSAAAAVTIACRDGSAGKRVIVLGFDGLDYRLTRDLMAKGRLPNFARVAAQGTFAPLGTSIPPQSPVAWSTFITGLDPGVHGIFDFVHRDPRTMTPYLSTTITEPGRAAIGIGKWQFPLAGGTVRLLRQGRPFWDVLEAHGIETTIVRMPANFPPSGAATRELSGMGTPDVLGTYGTFSLFTSRPLSFGTGPVPGGVVHPVDLVDGVVRGEIEGPENPFRRDAEKVTIPFTAHIDDRREYVKLVVGDQERLLRAGEWSDWVPLAFPLLPLHALRAQGRFYLRQVQPHFDLYVSPPNLDPLVPALPISTPARYAAELARATGRFYTQGMPEDTNALKSGALTPEEFLDQAGLAADENRRQYEYVLDQFDKGLLFYYFGHVDQVSHMMWRPMDPLHPAYDREIDQPYEDVVERLYVGLDEIVGETLSRLGDGDLLVIMSDHGFTSWRRAFHLNSWLRDQGYLVLTGPTPAADPGFFANVDWSRTRAYGLGLNGLYINVKGREAFGIVDPVDRPALMAEISDKLMATIDPATAAPAVTRVYSRGDVYTPAGHEDIAPDLVVGYAEGTRGSDESALGGIPPDVIVDNAGAWSGDHCMDHEAVPGILLTSRALRKPAPALERLAAAVLAEFGIDEFPAGGQ